MYKILMLHFSGTNASSTTGGLKFDPYITSIASRLKAHNVTT